MPAEQIRIAEDLRGLIEGDVLNDEVSLQLYASDASIYEIRPQCVVRPRTAEDVAATVRYALAEEIALHARGAGSGLAGESIGHGIVVDFYRYHRRVISVEVDSVRVEAGVVHGELNSQLAAHGRVFGPDPATTHVTTLGGTVGVDAAGSRWLRYGSTHQHVRSMQVVLADGEIAEISQHDPHSAAPGESPQVRRLAEGVAALVHANQSTIASSMPKSRVNRSGYALDRVMRNGQVDLTQLITGSEGTLGLVTEMTLATQLVPQVQRSALLVFDSIDKAAHCVERILPLRPSACDLMDRRHLSIARESDVRYELLIPQAAEAVLLIESCGDDQEEVYDRLHKMVRAATSESRLAAGAHIADDEHESAVYWNLARQFVPTLYRLQGRRRAIPVVEDIALPVPALPVFFRHLQDTLKRESITACVFGHVGHGQLHIRPLLDLTNGEDVSKLEALASELYEKVWLLGGTVSGEHGDGLSRTPFLSRQYGPLTNVFRDLKRMFDPQGLLNPGKVVPRPGSRMTHNLRHILPPPDNGESGTTLPLLFDWSREELAQAARACNGCAACRTRDEDTRMCPTNRVSPREEASPRAKANLIRSIATGELSAEALSEKEVKEVADLCVNCHMCRIECPANVDIPKLVNELKGGFAETNGLSVHDWFMANIDRVSAWASRTPQLTNRILGNRRLRWLLDKMFGIAPGRVLPRYARKNFMKHALRRKLDVLPVEATHKVAYFVDTYANYFEPRVASLLVSVLDHNGVGVYVPRAQYHSGMPMLAFGAVNDARRLAARNVAMLAEAVRGGCKVITTEPTAALALTREYPHLLGDDEDAQLVAENTLDSTAYLWQLHQQGALRLDFKDLPYEVAYHAPCHVLALERGTPAINLLKLVPSLRAQDVRKGCSGMAGTYGLQSKTYRSSLKIGLPVISAVRDGDYAFATTECSSCKLQIDQGSRKPVIHPVVLLAMAYGLASERDLKRTEERRR